MKKQFSMFDFVSVVQSCEFVRFCVFHNRELYERERDRFKWVDQGLFLLQQVLSDVHNKKFYRNVKTTAKECIRKHPLCAVWSRIMEKEIIESLKRKKTTN